MPASLRQAIVDNPGCAERYPDVEYQQLHQALAAHHRLLAAHILAGNGETESIFTLVHGLKPRRAMIVIPGFAEYRRALQTVDCEVVEYALQERDGWQLTDGILNALTPALDCLFLCTPNNPTGLLPERGLLEAIAQRCRALNISLILDEAFLDFIPDQPGFIPLLAQYPHVWVLRSLTKFYAIPGLRLGYLLNADARAVARLRERQMPWSINAYAALAGEIILQDRVYQRATWQWLQEEGARFYAQLQEMAGLTVWPGRANYLFLRCDRPDLDLQYALLRQHVLIRSCANYPGLDSRYFRVAIRSAGENDQLLAALRREARHRRIKTAIETCGCIPWDTLKEAAPYLNYVLFDVKQMDSEKHREGVGVGNELILSNLKKLLTEFPNLHVQVRTPIIPGFNDNDEFAYALGEFLKGYENVGYEALPYHRLGTQKYDFLSREYAMGDVSLPDGVAQRIQRIVDETRGAVTEEKK